MKTLKSFSALADVIGDNLPDGPKYTGSLYAHNSGESRAGRYIASSCNAALAPPRARGTGGRYGSWMGRTVYRISITRD